MTLSRDFRPLPPCSDELWRSVRYLLGELSAVDAAAFESELAENVVLADSLAEAVMLTESLSVRDAALLIAASPTRPLRRSTDQPVSPSRRLLQGLSIAAAALSLAALGWFGRAASDSTSLSSTTGLSSSARGDGNGRRPAGESRRAIADPVVSAWLLLGDGSELKSGAGEGDFASGESSFEGVSIADAAAGEIEPSVPGWMFAALAPVENGSASPEGVLPGDDLGWEEL